jgi:hypothetical protein
MFMLIALSACHWFDFRKTPSMSNQVFSTDSRLLSFEQWFLYRHDACLKSREERRLDYQQFEKHVEESWVLKRLALASCEPGLTPGLLRKSINQAKQLPNLSSSYLALIQLLESNLQAMEQAIEQKQAEVSALKKTLDALTKIEQQLEKKE